MKETRRVVDDKEAEDDVSGAMKVEKSKKSHMKQCQSQPVLFQHEMDTSASAEIVAGSPVHQGAWFPSVKGSRRKALHEARSQQLLGGGSPERSEVGDTLDKALPRSRRSKSTDSLSRKRRSVHSGSESTGQKSTDYNAMVENYKICFSLMELAQRVPASDDLLPIDEVDGDGDIDEEELVAKENVARHRSFHNKRTILPVASEAPVAVGSTAAEPGRRKGRRALNVERQRQQQQQQVTGQAHQANTDVQLPESSRTTGTSRTLERHERIVDVATGSVYYRGRLLGKGGFARCYELIDAYAQSQRLAGKIIPKPKLMKPNHKAKILREIDLHRHLSHTNIVAFFGDFEDDSNIYILLELCTRKSMVSIMKARKTLLEPEVRYYMSQLVEGCKYIHSRRIIHRDLKLGNILLTEQMEVKITDFGLATEVLYVGEKKTSVCGTPNYISPEVLSKRGYSYEVDIWAMGCIMYAMLVGKPPFETPNLKETYARIVANKYYMPPQLSSSARALIKWQLAKEPFRRPTLSQINSDDFFTSGFFPKTLPTHACYRTPQFPATRQASVGDSALAGVADLVGRPLIGAPATANGRAKDIAAAVGQPLVIPYFPVQTHQQPLYVNLHADRVTGATPVKRTPSKATRRWKSMDALGKHERADSRGRSRLGRLWHGIKRRIRSLSRKRKKNVSVEKADNRAAEQRRATGSEGRRRTSSSKSETKKFNGVHGREQQKSAAARETSYSYDELDNEVPVQRGRPVSRSTLSLATMTAYETPDSDDAEEMIGPLTTKTPVGPVPQSTPLTKRNIYGSNFSLVSSKTVTTVSSKNVSHVSANMSNVSHDFAQVNAEFSRPPLFTMTGASPSTHNDSHDALDGYVSQSQFMHFLDQKYMARSTSSVPNGPIGQSNARGRPLQATSSTNNEVNMDDSVTYPLRRAGSFPVAGSAIEMYHNLKKCLHNMKQEPDEPPIPMRGHSPTFITKWVDYSVKYGFGFQLTDGSVGVLFPDTTRMLLAADDSGSGIRLVHYNDLSNNVITFSTDEMPAEYKSKCTLLFYFSQYMTEHLVPGGDIITSPTVAQDDAIFLKKWFRTSRAIVMYLSNGTLQINFVKNHKKIIVNATPLGYCATFISSKRQATSYLLESLTESGCRQDMLDGLQYASRVMENIVNFEGESV